MLMTTLIFGAVFWIAVTGVIVKLAEVDGEDAIKEYCTFECKGFEKSFRPTGDLRSGNAMESTADMVQIMTFGGRNNA